MRFTYENKWISFRIEQWQILIFVSLISEETAREYKIVPKEFSTGETSITNNLIQKLKMKNNIGEQNLKEKLQLK